MFTILIVDSSSLILNVLSDLISKNNDFKVKIASSFEEATFLLSKNEFFLCISNLILEDALNGELIDVLDSKCIPTIILTADESELCSKKLKNKNVIDYILKKSINDLEVVKSLVELMPFMNTKKVLLLSDSSSISTKISNILNSLLLHVKVLKTKEEGFIFLKKENKVSMIIIDCNMVTLNTLDFLIEVKKNNDFSKIPIIVISDDFRVDIKTSLYKNGITDFLHKPILEIELKSKILKMFSEENKISKIKNFVKIVDENVISSTSDKKGIIKRVSSAFCRISGYEKSEMIGEPHSILRHPDMNSDIFKNLWATIKEGKVWKGEIKNLKKDGGFYWVKVIISPNFDNENNIISYTSVREDITSEKKIYELSIRDGLTSLYNRRHFNDIANSVITNTMRENNTFAFVLLDIDNFKKYNDTYGHQEGDNVLIQFSKTLKKTFKRSNDLVFRLGGEEFGILIGAANEEDIDILVNRARDNINKLNIEHKKNLPSQIVTASFGVEIIKKHNVNLELDTIYKNADLALYEAKKQGRDQIKYCNLT